MGGLRLFSFLGCVVVAQVVTVENRTAVTHLRPAALACAASSKRGSRVG
jgi:hypothetical protein